VGEVIRRRAATRFFSDGSIEGTCLRARQFSGWNGDSTRLDPTGSHRIRTVRIDDSDPVVSDCVKAWQASETSNLVPACVQYHAASVTPTWTSDFVFVVRIGHHLFYRRKTAAEAA
jgi:cell wall hydrolase